MTRSDWLRRAAALVVMTAVALPAVARAQEEEAIVEDDGVVEEVLEEPEIDPQAVEALTRMVKTLQGAERIHYRADEEYDAVQDDGETISFGYRIESWLRRPDRLRAEYANRDGKQRVVSYDGSTITVYAEAQNVYAAAPHTGDIDSLIDYLRADIGVKLPLADLFGTDLGQLLQENVEMATYLGPETLGDVAVDHVAFRYGTGAGVQIWIEQGERAVPHRLIITYEDAVGSPQFRASLYDWNLSPRMRDSKFEFEPPKNARKIPFMLTKRRQTSAPAEASQ